MSRINTNVQSLIAQRVLGQNQNTLRDSLEHLSTGLRINRGKDDPAGLIASENLRAELKSTNAAISNAERADQVVNIAEGGLQEVSGLLTELQGLITASASSAGLASSEKQANQLQIDSILQTIDRIASATSFQGAKLLNGNYDYKVSGLAAGVSDYKINGAKYNNGALDVNVLVTQSAQQGGFFLSFAGSALDLGGPTSSFTFEVGGSLGARQFTFASGSTIASVAASINSFKDVTGVQAKVSGTGLKLYSSDFGSQNYVSVKVVDSGGIGSGSSIGFYDLQGNNFNAASTSIKSTFANANNGLRDDGKDVGATINGIQATSNGKTARINTDFLDVQLTLSDTTAQTLGAVNGSAPALQIVGGGADFQLAGKVDIAGKVSLGITDIATRKLGNAAVGYLATLGSGNTNNVITGNYTNAQTVVSAAIEQITGLRGRLGAFQKNVVGATIRSLNIANENTAAAESVIRDADFATETAGLTRSQILVNASTNVLSLANQAPQAVLQLLGR